MTSTCIKLVGVPPSKDPHPNLQVFPKLLRPGRYLRNVGLQTGAKKKKKTKNIHFFHFFSLERKRRPGSTSQDLSSWACRSRWSRHLTTQVAESSRRFATDLRTIFWNEQWKQLAMSTVVQCSMFKTHAQLSNSNPVNSSMAPHLSKSASPEALALAAPSFWFVDVPNRTWM